MDLITSTDGLFQTKSSPRRLPSIKNGKIPSGIDLWTDGNEVPTELMNITCLFGTLKVLRTERWIYPWFALGYALWSVKEPIICGRFHIRNMTENISLSYSLRRNDVRIWRSISEPLKLMRIQNGSDLTNILYSLLFKYEVMEAFFEFSSLDSVSVDCDPYRAILTHLPALIHENE